MDAVLDIADKTFSGEECHGKYMDLHKHYMEFCNLKKLRQLNLIKSDDYLSWLQHFDKFHIIPLYLKQKNKYELYISDLKDYLIDFFQRVQPLIDFKAEVYDQVQEMFESEWEQRSLFGWETAIHRIYGESNKEE
jgi:splicing factor 3A subunit 3